MVNVKYNRWISRRRSTAFLALEVVALHNSKAKSVRHYVWAPRTNGFLWYDFNARGVFRSIDVCGEGS